MYRRGFEEEVLQSEVSFWSARKRALETGSALGTRIPLLKNSSLKIGYPLNQSESHVLHGFQRP